MLRDEHEIRHHIAKNRIQIMKANRNWQHYRKTQQRKEAKRAKAKWLDLHYTRDILYWVLQEFEDEPIMPKKRGG